MRWMNIIHTAVDIIIITIKSIMEIVRIIISITMGVIEIDIPRRHII